MNLFFCTVTTVHHWNLWTTLSMAAATKNQVHHQCIFMEIDQTNTFYGHDIHACMVYVCYRWRRNPVGHLAHALVQQRVPPKLRMCYNGSSIRGQSMKIIMI